MAVRANIIIDQGTDFSANLNVTDDSGNALNLSTYTIASQIRKHYTSSNSVSFSTSTANAENGIILLNISANTTSNMNAGRYVYDVELTSNTGIVTRLVEGYVTIHPQVTR